MSNPLKAKLKDLDKMEAKLRVKMARGEVSEGEARFNLGAIRGSREVLQAILDKKPGYRSKEEMQQTLLGMKASQIVMESGAPASKMQEVSGWSAKFEQAMENS